MNPFTSLSANRTVEILTDPAYRTLNPRMDRGKLRALRHDYKRCLTRGAGILAAVIGLSTLTIDVLTWAGVGPSVRFDQQVVLIAAVVVLTLVWATDAVAHAERAPIVRELVRQRQAEQHTAEALAELCSQVAKLSGDPEASGLDPEVIEAARRIARRLLDQE